ncbi:MAG: hypothetical protein FJW51_04705 [Actinobacteria bacterium]|nr:hypothetical protein [Actinomycetota bacterium]
MKLKVVLLSLSLLLVASSTVAQAQSPSSRIIGYSVTEGDTLQTSFTYLTTEIDEARETWLWCESVLDPDCLDKFLIVRAFLLPCGVEATLACIKDVYAIATNGKKITAKFVRSVAANPSMDLKEDLSRRLVAGVGTGGLWNFEGLSHGGGTTTYAVQAGVDGRGFVPAPSGSRPATAGYARVEFGIAAVREVSGDYQPNKFEFKPGTTNFQIRGADSIGSNGRPDYKCVMTETGLCFERTTFPSGYRFGMTVSLPNELSGWFHGRIYRPEISITRSGPRYDYNIEATPVKVPYIREQVPSSQWGKELVDFVDAKFSCNSLGDCGSTGGGFMMPGNSGAFAFDLTKLFLPVVKDKSSGTGEYWSVRTLDFWNEGSSADTIQSCSSNSTAVSGIVTTNSMIYSAGPPTYNADSSSLDYKVLSPHVNEKGEDNIGSYDLLLDSKVARCIYKFSDAPVKAEIEILGSDGTSKVATTVIGEKNGFLFMSANGFTYSEPTVRIKLKQDPVPVVTPTPTPTPSPTASATPTPTPSPVATRAAATSKVTLSSKKTTITCSKSGKIKKVTAVKPKCPSGFKKV